MSSFNFAREIGMIRMERRGRSAPRMTDGLFLTVLSEKDVSGCAFSGTMPRAWHCGQDVSVLFKRE